MRLVFAAAAAAASLLATPAVAVEDGADAGGFLQGFFDPILGFDHLIAMIAVGLLSAQIGGRAVWITPAAFALFLAIGAALSLAGVAPPAIEGPIALSVLALGLVIVLGTAAPAAVGVAVVGLFALFSGHAHGQGIPELAEEATAYGVGFLLASAALHLVGVALGVLQRGETERALLGAGVAGVGAHLVLLTYGIV